MVTKRLLGENLTVYVIPAHTDMLEFEIPLIKDYLPGIVKGIGMLGTAGIQAAAANSHIRLGHRLIQADPDADCSQFH